MSVAERRAREKQNRIQGILQAAEKVFFSKGYESATMNEIAREAELGKGTIYLYFKGKDIPLERVHHISVHVCQVHAPLQNNIVTCWVSFHSTQLRCSGRLRF
jgi:AcrR family transcriptional regulator